MHKKMKVFCLLMMLVTALCCSVAIASENDAWLLEYGSSYNKIDLNYVDPGTDKRFTIYLSYCLFEKDEYETLLTDYIDSIEQFKQDIEDSI